jgi:hypothetical protein
VLDAEGKPIVLEIAQIDVKPGLEAEFEAGVAKAVPLFRRAKGCSAMREREGELLFPDRFNADAVRRMEIVFGRMLCAGAPGARVLGVSLASLLPFVGARRALLLVAKIKAGASQD